MAALCKLKIPVKFNKSPPSKCITRCVGSVVGKKSLNIKKSAVDDKIALITGSASGIGYAIAKKFLKSGLRAVTIVDHDKPKALNAIKELTCEFGEDKALFIEADVSNSKQLDWAFRSTLLHYEGLNFVINNAGIINDTTWEKQIKTNLCGCVIGTLLGMQYMSKTCSGKGGTVVNIGSIMSLIPSSGCPLHTMTQFGILGFSRALGGSHHYSRTGVKIISYCPGLTDTAAFTNTAKNAINENFAQEFREEAEGCQVQKPESVARGLLSIIEESRPGSVWIAENGNSPYEVSFPEIASMRVKRCNENKMY